MCIILDINILPAVFSSNTLNHDQFAPVLNWITKGHGRVLIGGSKYKSELSRTPYLKFFSILSRYNRTISLNDEKVDAEQVYVEALETDPDFDDPHIIAMIRVSGCRLVCSNDKRSIRFVSQRKFYTRPMKPPKYYTKKCNESILVDTNIPEIYRITRLKSVQGF